MDNIEAKPLRKYPVIPGDGASSLLADAEAMAAVSVLRRLGYKPDDVHRAMLEIQYQVALEEMGADLIAAKDRVTTILQAAGLGFAASAVMRGNWTYLRSWLKESCSGVYASNEAVKELEALLAKVEVTP